MINDTHENELHYTESGSSSESTQTIMIDKITLVATYPESVGELIHDRAVKEICTGSEWDRPLRHCWGYPRRFAMHVPDSDGVVSRHFGDFSFGRLNGHDGVELRLEFNPTKVGQIGMEYLFSRMGIIGGGGAADFLQRARVNRVDVAVDMPGHQLDDVLIEAPKHRNGSLYTSPGGGAETVTTGSRRSHMYRRFYMKDAVNGLMRVEFELKPKVPVTELYLDQQEIDRLNVYFQRRHVLGHNDGHVDEKYVMKSGDQSYQPEQRIVVKVDAVLENAALLTKLVSGMRGTVSSSAPLGSNAP